MNQRLDTAIIGSGIISLDCGMVLQRQVWRVDQCAKPEQFGVAVKAGQYAESGLCRGWAAMNLSLFSGVPYFHDFCDYLASAGISLRPVKSCVAGAFPGQSWLGISNDAELSACRIEKLSENDRGPWKTLGAAFLGRADHIFAILGKPFCLFPFAKNLRRLSHREGLGGQVDLRPSPLLAGRPFSFKSSGQKTHHTSAVGWPSA